MNTFMNNKRHAKQTHQYNKHNLKQIEYSELTDTLGLATIINLK